MFEGRLNYRTNYTMGARSVRWLCVCVMFRWALSTLPFSAALQTRPQARAATTVTKTQPHTEPPGLRLKGSGVNTALTLWRVRGHAVAARLQWICFFERSGAYKVEMVQASCFRV